MYRLGFGGEITGEELLELYAAGERSFIGVSIVGNSIANGWFALKEADLREINLMGSHLSSRYLTGANLSNACLMGTILSMANLINANLTNANLINADLRLAHLGGANLTGADLVGVNLSKARMRYANLTGVDLSGANLAEANLTGSEGIDIFQTDGIFLWKTRLPDGNLEVGPRYSQ